MGIIVLSLLTPIHPTPNVSRNPLSSTLKHILRLTFVISSPATGHHLFLHFPVCICQSQTYNLSLPSPLPLGILHPFHCLLQGRLQEAKETYCLEGFSPGLSQSPRDCKPHPQCTSIQVPRAPKEPNKICSTEEWLHNSRTSGKSGGACQNLRRVMEVDGMDVKGSMGA